MKLGFLQFPPIRINPADNLKQIRKALVGSIFDLMVLPELANSGYLFESSGELQSVSEPADGSGIFLSGLIALAEEHHACIVSGFAEKSQEGII